MSPENVERRRWYGIRPGDEVVFLGEPATVVRLILADNNGCVLLDAAGKEFRGVCEWCRITRHVEDAPT